MPKDVVASLTDAWIETHNHNDFLLLVFVASLTDAWIETYFIYVTDRDDLKSHPSRMRGLKHFIKDHKKS